MGLCRNVCLPRKAPIRPGCRTGTHNDLGTRRPGLAKCSKCNTCIIRTESPCPCRRHRLRHRTRGSIDRQRERRKAEKCGAAAA